MKCLRVRTMSSLYVCVAETYFYCNRFLISLLPHLNSPRQQLRKPVRLTSPICASLTEAVKQTRVATLCLLAAPYVYHIHTQTPAKALFLGDVFCNKSTCGGKTRTHYYWWNMCYPVSPHFRSLLRKIQLSHGSHSRWGHSAAFLQWLGESLIHSRIS